MDLFVHKVREYKIEALFLFCLVCILTGLYFNQLFFFGIPIVGILAILLIRKIVWGYFLFFLLMPFSIEMELPGGLATDLPTEPLMWLITAMGTLIFLTRVDSIFINRLINPITLTLLLHIFWIGICIVFSSYTLISTKWFLAKLWYVIPFYFGAYYFLESNERFLTIIKLTFWPLLAAVLWILYRHYGLGFTFDTSNVVVYPIFRNHVNSASAMVLFLPFIWLLFKNSTHKLYQWIYGVAFIIFVIGIYFSYTRVAILCLPIGLATYFIIKWRLVKWALLATGIFFTFIIYFFVTNNRYVNFAPDFEKTITHTEFDNLLDATYKLEDISTMERVHRWVAGAHMLKERPLVGFGPATFYSNYKDYTIGIFETYVSHNPDHSGIHSYYLMTAVEQGFIGFLILLIMIVVLLLTGQNVYSNCKDEGTKAIIASCIISIVIILVINLINDTLEVDKVGPYFFTSMAVIGIHYNKQKK